MHVTTTIDNPAVIDKLHGFCRRTGASQAATVRALIADWQPENSAPGSHIDQLRQEGERRRAAAVKVPRRWHVRRPSTIHTGVAA